MKLIPQFHSLQFLQSLVSTVSPDISGSFHSWTSHLYPSTHTWIPCHPPLSISQNYVFPSILHSGVFHDSASCCFKAFCTVSLKLHSNLLCLPKNHLIISLSCLALFLIGSDQISRSVVSDSSRPHESQHARPPCPSPTPGVHSDSRPSSQWCHPAISSSVVPFSSYPQSLPALAHIVHYRAGRTNLASYVCTDELAEDACRGICWKDCHDWLIMSATGTDKKDPSMQVNICLSRSNTRTFEPFVWWTL